MRITSIYVLRDPRTNEIRYVGKTIQTLQTRLAGHLFDSAKKRTHRDKWISHLLLLGLKPQIEEIERTLGNWAERESFWILFYRRAGAKLTNHTDGGEGAPGNIHPASTRKKISDRLKIATANPDWRAARSKIMKEKFASPEFKAAHLERTKAGWTPEKRAAAARRIQGTTWTDKRRERARQFKRSPQQREAFSAAVRAVWTPELRESHRRSTLDRLEKKPIEWTPERRAEQSARAKKTWAEKPIEWTPEMRAAAAARIRANPPQKPWTEERRKAQAERIRARNLAKSAQKRALVNEKLSILGSEDIRCAAGDPSVEGAGDCEGAR
ncbi:GIY-YIG nuclease family protein [Paraburkholderia aspalathi]|uniref:GIY-YIG nuclease family protein n=1 Tax=Paraburkholderia aspalathi TaxID=1324617 RepID=UPI00190CBEFF|nr:GIY-YIG nuclease family protein [Paraburkholderia aspalathi]MBK3841724.1 GIY-YIG nuclease family protein [Paraburkholderia aspalathi]